MNPRAVYRDCVEAIGPLLRNPAVQERWDEPSALAEMGVSALAGHLIRVLSTVERYLAQPEPLEEGRLSPEVYFTKVTSDINSAENVAIRARGAEEAAGGYDALLAEYDRLRAAVLEAIRDQPSSRRMSVFGGQVLLLDDYLVTRIVEAVVHVDDLAVSCGIDTPALPVDAYEYAIRTLVDIARARHGDVAVMRGLARRERDDIGALRVF